MADTAKQKLIQFLERKAWDPVLKASAGGYSDSERKTLDRVQRKTQSQRERYQTYGSAGEVRQQFEDDLHSDNARKTNADLKRLDLPIQADVVDEFFRLADRLGVTTQRQTRGGRRRTSAAHHTSSRSDVRTGARRTSKSRQGKTSSAASRSSAKSPNGRRRTASTSKAGTRSATTRGRSSSRSTATKRTSRKTSSARKRGSGTAQSTKRRA